MINNSSNTSPNSRSLEPASKASLTGILDRFYKFNFRISSWCCWIGIVAITLMLVMTVVDVVGTKAFNFPVPGFDDATGLEQLLAISFAGAITLILGQHINVDMLTRKLPKRIEAGLTAFVTLLSLGVFSIIVWQLFILGQSFQESGELTEAWRLPFYPFAYLTAVAFIPLILILLWQILNSMVKAVKA